LPKAKCIIGFGFAVPKGIYKAMDKGTQYYTYTTMGVKYIDEEMAEIFLLKIGGMIENEGYDACLQKAIPNLRIKGDKTTNPEVMDTYELIHAEAVEEGKPVPDVIIDFGKAAKACGIGEMGLNGKILNKKYGPFMRYCFIITDAPIEVDEVKEESICDKCGACIEACPGNAVSEDGLDTWQCSVYYKGAHKSNPFITDEFLKGHPEREAILNGEKRFDAESAREIYKEMNFLPNTQWGYSPCLCGRKCDIACYKHIVGEI
jgi:ferredoxin